MQEQKEKLSYGRLVSRASFYRDKALDLEKKVVFAEEQVQALEAQVRQLNEENEDAKEKQAHFEQLKQDYEELKDQHQESQENTGSSQEVDRLTQQLAEKDNHIETLNQMISELKNSERSDKTSEGESHRIEQFEALLAEVQNDLNEKEQQLETYQARVKNLEKRLASKNVTPTQQVASQGKGGSKTSKGVIAFFDYSIILGQKSETIIRGNFHMENVGQETLGTPYVCFRFYPIDASTLKGKIISIDKAAHSDGSALQWVYLDDDWGEDAKARGEIWIRPYPNKKIASGEQLKVEDFQIPIKKQFEDKVIVEGFVYFQENGYKEKAANQILITF